MVQGLDHGQDVHATWETRQDVHATWETRQDVHATWETRHLCASFAASFADVHHSCMPLTCLPAQGQPPVARQALLGLHWLLDTASPTPTAHLVHRL